MISVISPFCFAQNTADTQSTRPAPPNFTLRLGVDAQQSTGNFNQLRASGRGNMMARLNDIAQSRSNLRYSYMKNGDRKFSDDLRIANLIAFLPDAKVQPILLLLYHSSFTRFIDQRWMTGGGAAYIPFNDQKHTLSLSMTVSYEWTTLDGRQPPFSMIDLPDQGCLYDGGAVRDCGRNMSRLIPRIAGRHQPNPKGMAVDYEALWVVDPLNLSDERVFLGLTVSYPMLSWLSLYTHYDLSYESVTLIHREQVDSHLSFGVSVNYIGNSSSPAQKNQKN